MGNLDTYSMQAEALDREAVMPKAPAEIQFASQMERSGLAGFGAIDADGSIHRFAPDGKTEQDAWYVLHVDPATGVAYGAYGNWADHSQDGTFIEDKGRSLSRRELEQLQEDARNARAAREEDMTRLHAEAALLARQKWDAAIPADAEHCPYLTRKGILPHDLRRRGQDLLVPITDGKRLVNVQTIGPDGSKRFIKGGEKAGCYSVIGDPSARDAYLCEGYATGASIFEATGTTTYVGLDAGNLARVAERLTAKGVRLTVVADNDDNHAGENGAKACRGCEVVVIPMVGGKSGTDANDYAAANGLDALGKLLGHGKPKPWLVPVDEAFIDKPEPIEWHVKHWLQRKAFMMVHGASGSGKSFLVLDWLLSVATGMEDWWGFRVHQCPVVYLCGEGNQGVHARIRAWVLDHGGQLPKGMYVSDGAVDLDDPAFLAQAESYIDAIPDRPGIIAIDTLNRFFSGDENSAQDARGFIKACSELTDRYGCSVLLVHHTGKDPAKLDEARGSSAWKAALDVEISVEKDGKTGIFSISLVKTKDMEPVPPVYGRLESVDIGWKDEDGEAVGSAVVRQVADGPKEEGRLDADIERLAGFMLDEGNGATLRDGIPFMPRTNLIACLKTEFYAQNPQGSSKDASMWAKNNLREDSGRWIGRLVAKGMIVPSGDGYMLVDDLVSPMISLVLNTRLKNEEKYGKQTQ